MKPLKMTKMDGAGNSFFIINLMEESSRKSFEEYFPGVTRQELAAHMCQPGSGDQADGMVYILPKNDNSPCDFQWDFYNADGSVAEMCGNAARCVASYAVKNKLTNSNLSFDTIAGAIAATVKEGNKVEIQMTAINEEKWDQTLITSQGEITYSLVNSGVPHVVLIVDDIDQRDSLRALSQELRKSDAFGPGGANITFCQPLDEGRIRSVSFERGVEDFTLACGTGAVAAARVHCGPPACTGMTQVEVLVPGGSLWVKFNGERPNLLGPTQVLDEIYLIPFRSKKK